MSALRKEARDLARDIADNALVGVMVPDEARRAGRDMVAANKAVLQDPWWVSLRSWSGMIGAVSFGMIMYEYVSGELSLQAALPLLAAFGAGGMALASKLKDIRPVRK